MAREIGSRSTEAIALVNRGGCLVSLGGLESARDMFLSTRDLSREIGARRVEGYALEGLGVVSENVDDPSEAERYYLAALDLRRDLDYGSGLATTLVFLGALLTRTGRPEEGTRHFREAQEVARETGAYESFVLATCHLAQLPNADPVAAIDAVSAHEARLGHLQRMRVHLLLHRATGENQHLCAAHDLLMFWVDHAPAQYRESTLTNVRSHRQVMEAWEKHGASET